MRPEKIISRILFLCALSFATLSWPQAATTSQPRIIELTADKDSRYRMGEVVAPTIQVLPGERLILRVTAIRAKEVARDGSIHGLALLDKDENAVPGWRFYLHPGVQDLEVIAPMQPGRYSAVCTIICSDMHDGMGFTVVVTKNTNQKAKE